MPRRALLVPLVLAASCALPRPYGEGVAFHTLLSGGVRALEHDTFGDGAAYGLEFATRAPASGWGYELGGTYAADERGGPRQPAAEFDELYLGLRRSWQSSARSARPYLGFGGAFTRIERTLHTPRAEATAEGGAVYAHGGVLWNLGRYAFDRGTEVLVGFDLRALAGDDHDYVQLALVLAFGR